MKGVDYMETLIMWTKAQIANAFKKHIAGLLTVEEFWDELEPLRNKLSLYEFIQSDGDYTKI